MLDVNTEKSWNSEGASDKSKGYKCSSDIEI